MRAHKPGVKDLSFNIKRRFQFKLHLFFLLTALSGCKLLPGGSGDKSDTDDAANTDHSESDSKELNWDEGKWDEKNWN